jgi:hypothetical protein
MCPIEIWDYMIPKGTSQTSVLNSTYEVQKIKNIILQMLGLWRNVIPKGTRQPDLNLVSQGCQHEKNYTSHPGLEPGIPASGLTLSPTAL